MIRIRRIRVSPAMAVACTALIVALGGTGYAAISLPRNSVGTAQLKGGAVTSVKVRDRSLLAQDFAAGQLSRGPQGAEGPEGPAGQRGPAGDTPAIAYAHIVLPGNVVAERSRGVELVAHPAMGRWCLRVTPSPKTLVATLDNGGANPFTDQVAGSTQAAALDIVCPGTTANVEIVTVGQGSLKDDSFYVVFY